MDLQRRVEIREWFLIFFQYSDSGDGIPLKEILHIFNAYSVSEKWGP